MCSTAGVSWVPALDLWRWTTTGDLSVICTDLQRYVTQLQRLVDGLPAPGEAGRIIGCPRRPSRDFATASGRSSAAASARGIGDHRPAPTLARLDSRDHRRAPHLRGHPSGLHVEEQPSVSFLQTPAWRASRPSGTASRWAGSTTVTSWGGAGAVPAGAEGEAIPGLHPGGSGAAGTALSPIWRRGCNRCSTTPRPRCLRAENGSGRGPAGGAPKR